MLNFQRVSSETPSHLYGHRDRQDHGTFIRCSNGRIVGGSLVFRRRHLLTVTACITDDFSRLSSPLCFIFVTFTLSIAQRRQQRRESDKQEKNLFCFSSDGLTSLTFYNRSFAFNVSVNVGCVIAYLQVFFCLFYFPCAESVKHCWMGWNACEHIFCTS